MLGGADNTNGELPSYITGANNGRPCSIRERMRGPCRAVTCASCIPAKNAGL